MAAGSSPTHSFTIPLLPPKPKYKVVSKGAGFWGKDLVAPESNLIRSLTSDGKNRIIILGDEYSLVPNQDVYVFDLNGNYIAGFTLPVPSKGIVCGGNNLLYSIEKGGTRVSKYLLEYGHQKTR